MSAVNELVQKTSKYDPFAVEFLKMVRQDLKDLPKYVKDCPYPRITGSGNTKLAKLDTIAFDLPAIYSCPGAGDCARSGLCFAIHFRYRSRHARLIRLENYLAGKKACRDESYREYFVGMIAKQIAEHGGNVTLRLHSGGDFVSQKYVDLWAYTLKRLSEYGMSVKAYCYTKSLMFDFSDLRKWCSVVQSYGGDYDHLIDENLPHAKIFCSSEQMQEEGYTDGSETDQCAIDGVLKIGLLVRPNTAHKAKHLA